MKTLRTFGAATRWLLSACLVIPMLALDQPPLPAPAAPTVPDAALPKLPEPDLHAMQVAIVLRIAQADLIVVRLDAEEVTVRLCGVDAPADSATDPADSYGQEAHTFANNLLTGERVFLKPHADAEYEHSHLDRLYYVYRAPDGLFVNAELIRQGYARCATDAPGRFASEFRALESRAMVQRKGLWGPRRVSPAAPSKPSPAGLAVPVPIPSTTAPAQRPAAVPNAPDQESVTVYRTRTGTKYHRAGCSYLRSGATPVDLKNAKASGLTPCSRCSPPS